MQDRAAGSGKELPVFGCLWQTWPGLGELGGSTAWLSMAWHGMARCCMVSDPYKDNPRLSGPLLWIIRTISGSQEIPCWVLGAVLQMLHLLLARLLEYSHPGSLKCNESPQNAMNHPETRTLPSPLSLPAQAVGGRSAGGPTCF